MNSKKAITDLDISLADIWKISDLGTVTIILVLPDKREFSGSGSDIDTALQEIFQQADFDKTAQECLRQRVAHMSVPEERCAHPGRAGSHTEAAFKQGYHLGFLHGYLFTANKKIFLPNEEAVKDHASGLEEAARDNYHTRNIIEPIICRVLELVDSERLPQKELVKSLGEAARQLKNCWQEVDRNQRRERREWWEIVKDAELYVNDLARLYEEVFNSVIGRSIFSHELRDKLAEIIGDFSMWLEDLKSSLTRGQQANDPVDEGAEYGRRGDSSVLRKQE